MGTWSLGAQERTALEAGSPTEANARNVGGYAMQKIIMSNPPQKKKVLVIYRGPYSTP